MRVLSWFSERIMVKLAALLLSLLLWGGVVAGRNGAEKVRVPLRFVNLAPGLVIRGNVPADVEVAITGPRLLLYQLQREQLAIELDFSGVTGGLVNFDHLSLALDLNPGLRAIRTTPGRLQVWVEPRATEKRTDN